MEENKEKTVKKRQECDPAYQWHIQDLYTSDEAWEKDYESLTSEIQSLASIIYMYFYVIHTVYFYFSVISLLRCLLNLSYPILHAK